MSAKTIPVRVGDVEVLVEVVPVAGTEPTSVLPNVGDRVLDVFERTERAIVEIAASTADVIGAAAKRGARPDHLEVEFGLKISAKGNVIIGSGSGEATLRVKLTYDRPPPPSL